MPIKTAVAQFPIVIPDEFSDFQSIRIIGRGGFSVVALIKNKITGVQYACKIVPKQLLEEMHCFEMFKRELHIQKNLHHPNILQIYDVLQNNELYFVVMEYCENGDLLTAIKKRGKFNEDQAKRFFFQIISGIQYMHSMNIVHRDLKPENILLNSAGNIKIADFGLCRQASDKSLLTTPCGSCYYAPPEIIICQEYDGKMADVWSAGVVLFTIVTGTLPWAHTKSLAITTVDIVQGNFSIPEFLSEDLTDLLSRCLRHNPTDRIKVNEIIDHPWLSISNSPFISVASTKEGCEMRKSLNSIHQAAMGIISNSPHKPKIAGVRSLEPIKRKIQGTKRIIPTSSFQFE